MFAVVAGCAVLAQAGAKAFTRDELIADLDHLQRKLLRVHPAPFMYATPERFSAVFDSLRSTIGSGMSGLRFLAHISRLHALLGDGHTMLLPSDEDAVGRYLPFDAVWSNGRLHVQRNGSNAMLLEPGTEIRAINGIPAAAVVDTLLMRQIRDGWNATYPHWIINQWFRAYYRFSFGEPERFDLVIGTAQGEELLTVPPLPSDSIRANFARNGAALDEQPLFSLRFVQNDSIAMLTIPSFAKGSVTNKQLDEAFREIRLRRAQGLVLDVRGNQGGEPKHAKRLLSHLMRERFELVRKGPAAGSTEPRRDAFTGKLVVLMDGGSFSVTGMVLSCLERHGRATFIGEEAGGNRTLLAGSPRHLLLPNTRIHCYISTRLWHLADRPNDGHGVAPTIKVARTPEDMLAGRDNALDTALLHFRTLH